MCTCVDTKRMIGKYGGLRRRSSTRGLLTKKTKKTICLVSEVDVMITFFCHFRPFSAKNLAFFSKTHVMIKFLHNLALFLVKTPFFR
jgi:hypothetical protein